MGPLQHHHHHHERPYDSHVDGWRLQRQLALQHQASAARHQLRFSVLRRLQAVDVLGLVHVLL